MNEAGHDGIWQFDHQPVISNVHDRRAENVRVSFVELLLKKLKFFQADGFDLGFGRVAFRIGNVIGQRFELADVDL